MDNSTSSAFSDYLDIEFERANSIFLIFPVLLFICGFVWVKVPFSYQPLDSIEMYIILIALSFILAVIQSSNNGSVVLTFLIASSVFFGGATGIGMFTTGDFNVFSGGIDTFVSVIFLVPALGVVVPAHLVGVLIAKRFSTRDPPKRPEIITALVITAIVESGNILLIYYGVTG